MPTRGRSEFARESINCYLRQTWEPRELIVVDDADNRSFPDGLRIDGVQYHLMERRLPIGAKRNIAVGRSRGEIICHWDDDDFSEPGRIEDQVLRMFDSGKAVSGYHSMRFLNLDTGKWWRYNGKPDYSLGSALCYRREFWTRNPFPVVQVGEDGSFVRAAQREQQIVAVDADQMMWATTHGGNSSPRRTDQPQWSELL
jgi:glycosyltransferase involved in cell wall biosynthesis